MKGTQSRSTAATFYTDAQIATWLRGLLAVAWADGDFSPDEREAIGRITQQELAPTVELGELERIEPAELAQVLGGDRATAENFMRTAVMVAITDGLYTPAESQLLNAFAQALGLELEALKSLERTLSDGNDTASGGDVRAASASQQSDGSAYPHTDLLQPVKEWLQGVEVRDPRLARFICRMIPAQCPFEREIKLFGYKIVRIPPLCKLNPLYEQLVDLRFRALSYLADECGEDVSQYV